MAVTQEQSIQINSQLAVCEQLKHQGRFSEIEQILSGIRKLVPNHPFIEQNYAFTLFQMGELAKAERVINELLRKQRTADLIFLKCSVLAAQKKYNDCVNLALTSVENGIMNFDLVQNSAMYYISLQEPLKAQKLISTFMEKTELPEIQRNILTALNSLLHYITGDFTKTKELLSSLTSFISNAEIGNSSSREIPRIMQIYAGYLSLLINWRENNAEACKPSDNKIYLLGDSHSISPAYVTLNYKGKQSQIIPKLSIGTKIWHIHKRQEVQRINGIKKVFSELPDNSTIFLSFGEIDCRINEGIFPNHLKNPDSDLRKDIETLVNSYVDFIQKSTKKNFDLKYISVPCPNPAYYEPKAHNLSSAQLDSYLSVPRIFNEILKEKVGADNFIDVYAPTSAGKADASKHFVDEVHLLPNIYRDIIEKL